jgi:hypothetical protein
MIGNVVTQESIVLAVGGVTAHGIAQTTRREDCRDRYDEQEGDCQEEQCAEATAAITTASFDFKARRPTRSTASMKMANTACPGASHAAGE